MAAHLHRYKSELNRIETVLSELQPPVFDAAPSTDQRSPSGDNMEGPKVLQLISQLSAIISFSDELERKVQNILTLVG
jgi:hypothetical protein